MKNLKDYFSSPKSEEIKVDEQVAPTEKQSTKRKPRISLSSKKSKKKKLSIQNDEIELSSSEDCIVEQPTEDIIDPPALVHSKKSAFQLMFEGRCNGERVKNNNSKVNGSPQVNIISAQPTKKRKSDDNGSSVRTKTKSHIANDVGEKQLENVSTNSIPNDVANGTNRIKKRKRRRRKNISLDSNDDLTASSKIISEPDKRTITPPPSQDVSDTSGPIDKKTGDSPENVDDVSIAETRTESRHSLLSYFNKVDKSFEVKSEDKKTFKVEALVHEPRSCSSSLNVRLSIPKKIKKGKKQVDFDLITSEEDSSFTQASSPWQMRISLQPQNNGDCESEDSVPSLDSFSSHQGTTEEGDEVIILDGDNGSNNETECGNSKLSPVQSTTTRPSSSTPAKVIVVDDESRTPTYGAKPNISKSTPTTASLRAAGGLAAYFGVKTESSTNASKNKSERCAATQQFLTSPAPDCLVRPYLTAPSKECNQDMPPFPKWNHITQTDGNSSLPNFSHKFCEISPFRPVMPKQCDMSSFLSPPVDNSVKLHVKPTRQQITAAIKVLTNEMKENSVNGSKWMESLKMMKKRCIGGKGELWADKYRPSTADAVLLGRHNVNALSLWLSNFQSTNSEQGSDTESSGDEFVNDKDKSRIQGYDGGNTAFLIGPPGVGKTAAVFAAAKQNGYQVLELNASCNRNGKKVYQEFSEATQSHKVETKSPFKMKSKKKEKLKTPSSKQSLLLIEDSDVVLSQVDEGYISCLSGLQSSSKRPLVLVANDPSCRHLKRLIPTASSALRLSFDRPDSRQLGYYLQGVSLVEGHVLTQEACDNLVESSGLDLRKALLNLQFYSSVTSHLDRRKLGLLDYRDQSCFSLPSHADSSQNSICRDDFISMLKRAKLLCSVDLLTGNTEEESGKFNDLKESCEVEPRTWDPVEDNIRSSVRDCLITPILNGTTYLSYGDKGRCHNGLDGAVDLSEAVEERQKLGREGLCCDYMSSLRQVARSEQIRLQHQTKRNKRYFNYLHSLGVDTSNHQKIVSSCSVFSQPTPCKSDDVSSIT